MSAVSAAKLAAEDRPANFPMLIGGQRRPVSGTYAVRAPCRNTLVANAPCSTLVDLLDGTAVRGCMKAPQQPVLDIQPFRHMEA